MIQTDGIKTDTRLSSTDTRFSSSGSRSSATDDRFPRRFDRLSTVIDKLELMFVPVHQEYYSYETRRASFHNWPLNHCQNPDLLAEAGFFYKGLSDECYCFHCGIGIYEWERKDNPFIEHARWSPHCHFVYLESDVDFIINSLKNNPPMINAKMRH